MKVKFEYNHNDVEQLFDTIIDNDNTDVFKYLIAELPDINKKWSDGKTFDAALMYFQDEECRNDAIFFFSTFNLNNDHIIKAAERLSEKDFAAPQNAFKMDLPSETNGVCTKLIG